MPNRTRGPARRLRGPWAVILAEYLGDCEVVRKHSPSTLYDYRRYGADFAKWASGRGVRSPQEDSLPRTAGPEMHQPSWAISGTGSSSG